MNPFITTHYHESPLPYTGKELCSHFAYNSFNIAGDSLVAFCGPCDVPKEHMVDLEDVHQNQFIYSENMLHFIAEHFTENFEAIVILQRLLVDCLLQELTENLSNLPDEERPKIRRVGDDLLDNENHKWTVSIATRSPVSCLIHTGINISSKNTPLPTRGLDDYQINPLAFATGTLNRYRQELQIIHKAKCKVRPIT